MSTNSYELKLVANDNSKESYKRNCQWKKDKKKGKKGQKDYKLIQKYLSPSGHQNFKLDEETPTDAHIEYSGYLCVYIEDPRDENSRSYGCFKLTLWGTNQNLYPKIGPSRLPTFLI